MGVILVLLSGLAFTMSSYYGKVITNTTAMSGVIGSFSRFLFGTICMFIYILITKKDFRPQNLKPIFFRAVYNSFAIILFSTAYKYSTITNINMLHMTYPLFVILIAPYFTGEKVSKSTYFYLTVIMIGSYIVADPSFGNVNFGDLLAITSAVVAAFSIMYLTISRQENEGYIIVFYVMLIGTLVNIPFAYKDLSSFDFAGIIPVFLTASLGFLGQIFLTWGYKFVDSATGALVSTSRIVMSALVGYLLLSEPLETNIIIGIILITSSLIGLSGFFNKKQEVIKDK